MDGNRVIIQLDGVSFSYPGTTGPVLDNVQFALKEGERLGLIGHNGSGKTTLLHIVMGLLGVSSGTVRFFDKEVTTEKDFREIRRKVGFLFQNPDDQLFSPTVLEDVAFGPMNLGKTPEEAKEMSIQTLKDLNLDGFEGRITHKLSGGEKRLVALATVLVMNPEVLLLDEPSTGLDEDTNNHLMNILNELEVTYLIVSHEYDFLARTSREIYSIQGGRIFYNGDASTLHTHYHRHPTGRVPHDHL